MTPFQSPSVGRSKWSRGGYEGHPQGADKAQRKKYNPEQLGGCQVGVRGTELRPESVYVGEAGKTPKRQPDNERRQPDQRPQDLTA